MAKKKPTPAIEDEPLPAAPPGGFVPWTPPKGLSKRGWAILGFVVLMINAPILHLLFRGAPPVSAAVPYSQRFDSPAVLRTDFSTTGGYWRVVDGRLISPGVKDNPLWLQATIPRDAIVEFDASPLSPDAEVRAVLFGDGRNAGSAYAFVQGANNNNATYVSRLGGTTRSWNQLLREAESKRHAANPQQTDPVAAGLYATKSRIRIDARHVRLEAGATHRWRIERRGNSLQWWIDGQHVLTFDDPFPLGGTGHDRFGLNTLEGSVAFDNLEIKSSADVPPSPTPEKEATDDATPRPFADNFDDGSVSRDWNATDSAAVSESNGALIVEKAHNQPVWLRLPLAQNARIEFDAWTDDPRGDIKFEAWGDGESRYSGDLRLQYRATGYVFIFGGWGNRITAIARQDEHAPDRRTRDDLRVERGRRYRMKLERTGGTIVWSIDGSEVLRYVDSQPLYGRFNRHFAFSGWESKVYFDNLAITPL